jgi:hypothetical protein
MREPNVNNGVIAVEPTLTDFKMGGETGIVEIVRNPSGNWIASEPPGEWQRDMKSLFESDACVSFGADDSLETQCDLDIRAGRLPQTFVTWLKNNGYFNPDGTLNFSDRFTAKMSGTTQNGNSLPAVWASIKANGLVPESAWPFPLSQMTNNQQADWNIYYATVPAEVVALGKEFLAQLQANGLGVFYEWVVATGLGTDEATLSRALTISPLQIATAVCSPWNTANPIQGCGPGAQHSTMLAAIDANGIYEILDHYSPFQKKLASNYNISYAMRGVIQPLYVPPQTFQYTFTKYLVYEGSNDATELKALQTALQLLTSKKTGKAYMPNGVFGPYGPQTKLAVAAFQADYGIADDGSSVGPQTRAALNAALLAL